MKLSKSKISVTQTKYFQNLTNIQLVHIISLYHHRRPFITLITPTQSHKTSYYIIL